jgi:hypothetical protein
MAIGKSLRFQVFARDGFACQYCGRRPPEIVLEVDHIHPVSRGGDDDPINLITSCFDCNRSKAAKLISAMAPRPDADLQYLALQQEIAEANRFLKTKRKRDRKNLELCEALRDTWRGYLCPDVLPSDVVLLPWIKSAGAEEVEACICLAGNAYQSGRFGLTQDQAFRKLLPYVGAIMRNRKERRSNEEPM